MPDNPDKPDQEPFFDPPDDESAASGPPDPEQIWPPANGADAGEGESSAGPDDASASDDDWVADTHELDEAIEEIRRLNGGAGEPSEPEPEPEPVPVPEAEAEADREDSRSPDFDEDKDDIELEAPEPIPASAPKPEELEDIEELEESAASEPDAGSDEIELDISEEPPETAARKLEAMVAGQAPTAGEDEAVETPSDMLAGVEAELEVDAEVDAEAELEVDADIDRVDDAEPAPVEAGERSVAEGAVWPPDNGASPGKASTPVSVRVRGKSEGELSQLWGNVFFSAQHESPRVVAVAPVRRGDGATQIATSLALLGAGADKELRIALVDLNLRHSGIADAMGVNAQPGVKEVLDGSASLEDAMQAVRLDNGNMLHVLAAGGDADHPMGLIRSRQMQATLARLRERYDHVILDVASADSHPDAQVIGRLVDGVLLVVSGGSTPRETAADVKKRLELVGAVCLGLVLNQRSDPVPGLLYRMT